MAEGFPRGKSPEDYVRSGSGTTRYIPNSPPPQYTPRRDSTQSRRQPGGNDTRAVRDRAYDPTVSVNALLSDIAAEFDAERAALAASFGGGGGGGGGSGYADVIADLQETLDDVMANRKAAGTAYDEYGRLITPLAQQAIDSAAQRLTEGRAGLAAIDAQGQKDIKSTFSQAERDVAEFGKLIQAGAATKGQVASAGEGEALRIAQAIEQAIDAKGLLEVGTKQARAEAVAGKDLDEGTMRREKDALDLEFQVMEQEVQEQLIEAREAAARAAAAAASRRRAMANQRAAALAELENERYAAMRINPHEAGEATALTYLSQNAGHLDYNRQQLILSTVSNAISQQVRPEQVARYARENGVRLNQEEQRLVQGGVGAYGSGMRYQQRREDFTQRNTRYAGVRPERT